MRFNLLDLLLPRETKFFDLFCEHADRLVTASRKLRDLTVSLDSQSDAGAREMLHAAVVAVKDLEKEADKIEARINEAIDESFITPLDREDIHLIATYVDNAIDAVKALTHKVENYGMFRMPRRSLDFTDIVVECAQLLAEAFERIKKRGSMTAQAKAIGEAERRGDYLFSIAIGDLFKEGTDPIEVIKSKEIYEGLEEIINRIDAAAKVLRRVMIKQS
ncbi:MAG TPA: DUF47 family protein [Rectinemataceae bacterium]|nr:DUF47 family protein [Rectinemataceae bacterium]